MRFCFYFLSAKILQVFVLLRFHFRSSLLLSCILLRVFPLWFFSVHFFTATQVLVSCMLPVVSFWSSGILFGDLYVWLLLHVFGWCCWFVVHKGQYFWLFVVFPLMRWSTKEHPWGKFVSFFFLFCMVFPGDSFFPKLICLMLFGVWQSNVRGKL